MIRIASTIYQFPLSPEQDRVLRHYDTGQLLVDLIRRTAVSRATHDTNGLGRFIEFELGFIHDNELVRADIMRRIEERIQYCFEQQAKWEGETAA